MKRILGHAMSPSLAVSALALTLAFGGGSALATAGLIGPGQIMNGAVTTPKLAFGAVTTPKLANGGVTTCKLANGAVTPAKIAAPVCRNVAVFTNGWMNAPPVDGFHSARACKDALGYVHLDGLITGGTAFTTALVLPRAFRPTFNHSFPVSSQVSGGPALEHLVVRSTGAVIIIGPANGTVSLDGVSYLLG